VNHMNGETSGGAGPYDALSVLEEVAPQGCIPRLDPGSPHRGHGSMCGFSLQREGW